ncbi:MAG: molybdopterin-dependent oxidoreductase [Rhodanobacteraceae bacterium]
MSAGSGGSRESRVRGAFAAFALALTFASAPALTREAGIAPALEIGGERVTPAHLTLADLSKLPRVRVHASAHGEEADWDGVPLIELLESSGAPVGDALRGPALALYVRVTAVDGYRAVFALAEIDPSTGNAQAILADRKNSQPIDDREGPLRLIVPGDKRPARWVRQVIAIELIGAPDSHAPARMAAPDSEK